MTRVRAVIPAKLEPPRLRRSFLARPLLTARLDESLEGRVTLISAPAGYGKSTVVGQWLEGSSAPASAWLSLDPLDSDLERFTRYVVAALRGVEPACLPQTERLLSAPNLPPPQYLAETMVFEMDGLGQQMVLVLDDYSAIREEAVHELLSAIVPMLPERLRLVILSRVDPPLPVSLWRSRHWLEELRAADLRFSHDEATALFHTVEGLDLSDEAIDAIHRKTEGWITGLRLALLERFCAPLCDHLLEGRPDAPDSRTVLDRLYRSNMFLFPLGALHGWYRYHHLFRDLLLDRFGDLAPTVSRDEICRRAGAWFAGEGWLEEGLQYLLEAGDLDAATDLLAEHLHAVINSDLSRRTLARWLAMFPPGAERGRLPLIVASLYMMVLRFDFEAMLRLIEEAEPSCREAEDERRRRWWEALGPDLAALRAYALFWQGDPAAAHEHASRVMSTTTDPRGYQYALAIQYLVAGLALAGRRDDALQFVGDSVITAGASGSPLLGLYFIVAAFVHLYAGELESCRVAAREGIAAGDRLGAPKYFYGHAHLILGSVAYERNLLDEAEAHFREVEALRFDANRMARHDAVLGLAQVALARGDPWCRGSPRRPDQPRARRPRAAAAAAVEQGDRGTARHFGGDRQDAHPRHLPQARRGRPAPGGGGRARAGNLHQLRRPDAAHRVATAPPAPETVAAAPPQECVVHRWRIEIMNIKDQILI